MIKGFKTYKTISEVEEGDLVSMDWDTNNPGYSNFQTCIVTKIVTGKNALVHLARPHARFCPNTGTVFTTVNEFIVPLDSFITNFKSYTTGPSGLPNSCSMDMPESRLMITAA